MLRACHQTHLLNFCFVNPRFLISPKDLNQTETSETKKSYWIHGVIYDWPQAPTLYIKQSSRTEPSRACWESRKCYVKMKGGTRKVGLPIAHRRAVVIGGRGCWGHAPLQILADQLTLTQPGKTDYSNHSTTWPPWFSDLPTAHHHCLASGPLYIIRFGPNYLHNTLIVVLQLHRGHST